MGAEPSTCTAAGISGLASGNTGTAHGMNSADAGSWAPNSAGTESANNMGLNMMLAGTLPKHDQAAGTHTMWVYDTDQPHTEGSGTDPRTEMRWQQEYTTGQHMWDGDLYVPSGTNGAT